MISNKVDVNLEAKIIEAYKAHKERTAKIAWAYHDFMPWDKGSSFINNPWDKSQVSLPDGIVKAIETSMLTEINLPWYTSHIERTFKGSLSVMKDFMKAWVSEEDQHATALETYLMLTRNSDPNKLSDIKKQVMELSWSSYFEETPIVTMAYTTIQELGTLVFYQNVAKAADKYDPDLGNLLRRLGKDESLHFAFYNKVIQLHLQSDPNYVYHLADVIKGFSMPGAVIPDFKDRMELIAKEANYGSIEYFDQVLDVLIKRWGIKNLRPTLKEAEEKRQEILKYHALMKRVRDRSVKLK